ncbi:Hypothetical predicted protein [Olea europaea subsp. europaea]|uniref:Uncharacterized protein n=1 Tax=Olea europaea subsp. europaea TaxID=158383 RepID=A0A8S0VH28_OLEEU|nr:Hypothetical predicted protein [Olea europaea subsp. europaea]
MILVGHNINDKKFYIAAAFRKTDRKLLCIRDLIKDLTIYGVEDLKLEPAVEKALRMENGGAIESVKMKKRSLISSNFQSALPERSRNVGFLVIDVMANKNPPL